MLKALKEILWGALFGTLIATQALGQTATLLPNAKQQFFTPQGIPAASGTVDMYVPSTTTRKTTWKSSTESSGNQNTNPVLLDAGGYASIYGDGAYRQVVKDADGNTIWDAVTASTGGGSGPSPPSGGGDGTAVGTILSFSGLVAPTNYVFAYGQAISRTTYAQFMAATTLTTNVICTSGLNVLSGISDTTQIRNGAPVEASCVAPGTTVISVASTSVTVSNNASISTSISATFFPNGNGDGSTTLNVPDLRGQVIAGRNNMGGTAGSALTSLYFGTSPNALGAAGGSQSYTLLATNQPSYTPTGTNASSAVSATSGSAQYAFIGGGNPGLTGSAAQGITDQAVTVTGTAVAQIFTGNAFGGGIAVSATVGNAGSGYTTGTQTLTVTGGTCTTQPQFSVTVSGGNIASPVLVTAGQCSVAPSNPASTSGGGGSGGTLNVTYSAVPFSKIQPTTTMNYIIKVIADGGGSGTVTSIDTGTGLTGGPITSSGTISFAAIAADNLLANPTGSSAAPIATPIGSCSGASNALIYNTSTHMFGCNTITGGGGGSGTVTNIATGTGLTGGPITTTGTISFASIAADNLLANSTSSSAPPVATSIGSCSGASNALIYNTSTHAFGCNTISGGAGSSRLIIPSTTYFVDDINGSDSNSCTAATTGACKTLNGVVAKMQPFDLNSQGITVSVAAPATTYAGMSCQQPWVGLGTVTFTGNIGSPTSIGVAGGSLAAFNIGNGCQVTLKGFSVSSTGSNTITAVNNGRIVMNSMDFGTSNATSTVVFSTRGSYIEINDSNATVVNTLHFGTAQLFGQGSHQGEFRINCTTACLKLTANVTASQFVFLADGGAVVGTPSASFNLNSFTWTGNQTKAISTGEMQWNGNMPPNDADIPGTSGSNVTCIGSGQVGPELCLFGSNGASTSFPVFYSGVNGYIVQNQVGGTNLFIVDNSGNVSFPQHPLAAPSGGTGNVSPTAHTVPINEGSGAQAQVGPGTSGQVLTSNGAGNDPSFQAAAPVAGSWVLINTLTPSGSAAITDTSSLGGSYDEYEIVWANLLPATNAVTLTFQVYVGGVQVTSYSGVAAAFSGSAGSNFTSATYIPISNSAGLTNVSGHAGGSGSIRITNPTQTVSFKNFLAQYTGQNGASGVNFGQSSGFWAGSTAAVTGFSISASSGNLQAIGSVRVYGRM